jgi:hypothetical protein
MSQYISLKGLRGDPYPSTDVDRVRIRAWVHTIALSEAPTPEWLAAFEEIVREGSRGTANMYWEISGEELRVTCSEESTATEQAMSAARAFVNEANGLDYYRSAKKDAPARMVKD